MSPGNPDRVGASKPDATISPGSADRLASPTAPAADTTLWASVGKTQRQAVATVPAALDSADPHPDRIGPYRILRHIGRGGMGVVCEAEQDQPRRTVALKLMRRELGNDSDLRRFHYEAEILGRLRHPGIAHVYDAGTFGGGRPYYAMEFIPQARTLLAYAADAPNARSTAQPHRPTSNSPVPPARGRTAVCQGLEAAAQTEGRRAESAQDADGVAPSVVVTRYIIATSHRSIQEGRGLSRRGRLRGFCTRIAQRARGQSASLQVSDFD